jgi:hypothetical protein
MRLILSVCRAASVSYPRLRTSAPVVGIIMRRLSPTKFSGPRALPGWRRRPLVNHVVKHPLGRRLKIDAAVGTNRPPNCTY